MAFLISVLSLSVIIIWHEAGHFLWARRFGMPVEEFGIGYPPRIFGFKKNGVIYSLNAIPFGGFVRIVEYGHPQCFAAQSLGKRAMVLLAGALNNFLAAFLVFTVLFWIGMPSFVLPASYSADLSAAVSVREVEEDSPAFAAGLAAGDLILGIEQSGEYHEVQSASAVQTMTEEFRGQEVALRIAREEETLTLHAVLRETTAAGEGYLGVALTDDGRVRYSLLAAPWQALRFMGFTARETFAGLGSILVNLCKHGSIEGLSGPVGIVAITAQGFQWGGVYGWYILGLVSYAFAIFNLLPIPAVDGGRILFLLIEKIRKRPVSQRAETIVNNVFFSLLLILFFIVTIKDIHTFILN